MSRNMYKNIVSSLSFSENLEITVHFYISVVAVPFHGKMDVNPLFMRFKS